MKFKKLIVPTIISFLIISLFSSIMPYEANAYSNPVENIKIGLFYSDTALPAAHLENHTGAGYMFGYYDSNRIFNPLASTDETKITMIKDWNMYFSGVTYFDKEPDSYSGVVGCYHIKLSGVYNTYEEAAAAASGYTDAFPAYYNGNWNVCVGNYTSYNSALEAMNNAGIYGEPMTASAYCITVVATGTNRILFEYDCGSGTGLGVMPKAAEGVTPQTWFKGYRYNGGFQYMRITGENMTVVNFVSMEDYVKGVVPYEMNPSWPIEALKAQALCARTYGASHINNHRSHGFDLCNTTHCQVYRGQNQASENSNSAVDLTAGQYVMYNGDYCQTFFHSSDGGATEDCENVFKEALPYIRGVIDEYEKNENTGYSDWSFTYSAENITWILQAKGYNCGNIVSVTPTYTRLGNIYSLKFTDDKGKNWNFAKYDAGCILYSATLGKYTYSQRFTIAAEGASGTTLYVNDLNNPIEDPAGLYAIGSGGNISAIENTGEVTVLTGKGTETVRITGGGLTQTGSSYIVKGSGWGHNVGMSQYGAKAMANLGYTYDQIVSFYFTGITIA